MRDAMGDAMGETERRRGCRGRRGPITSKKNVDAEVVFRAQLIIRRMGRGARWEGEFGGGHEDV